MKSNLRLRLRRPTTLSLINNGRASHQHPLVWFLDTLPRSSGSPAALQRLPKAGQRHAPWPTLQSRFRPPLLEPQEPHRRQPGALLLLLLLPANGCRGPDLWGPDRGILETTGGSSGTPASRNKAHKGTHPPPRGLLAGPPVLSASPPRLVSVPTRYLPRQRIGHGELATASQKFKLCSQPDLGLQSVTQRRGFSSAPPPGGTARPDQHPHHQHQHQHLSWRSLSILSSRFETTRRPIPSQSKFQVPTNPGPSPSLPESLHTSPAARSRVDFPPSASHLGRSLLCRRLAICLFCLVGPDK